MPERLAHTLAIFFRHKVQVSLQSKNQHENLAPFREAVCGVFASHDSLTEGERHKSQFRNTLLSPYQPLMDNLESSTYEFFEMA